MTAQPSAHGVAPHFEIEPFTTVARNELLKSPPWQFGLCFNPGCSRPFTPSRDWQIYCCVACKTKSVAEMRLIGHRMAMPALVWRMGKYNRDDAGVMELTKAARREFTRIQSAWVEDRNRRKLGAM